MNGKKISACLIHFVNEDIPELSIISSELTAKFPQIKEKRRKLKKLSFQKMLNAIGKLGYEMPNVVKSDQGPEFSGPGWKKQTHIRHYII